MAQTKEANDRYSNVKDEILRKYLRDYPIEDYIDLEDDPTEFEVIEPARDTVLEIDAKKAISISRQILWECLAESRTVNQWLTTDIMKSWSCKARLVERGTDWG